MFENLMFVIIWLQCLYHIGNNQIALTDICFYFKVGLQLGDDCVLEDHLDEVGYFL